MNSISAILADAGSDCYVSQIRAVGVGHFCLKGTHSYGCHQLALLVLLKHYFNCEVTFQEPVATDNEKVMPLQISANFQNSVTSLFLYLSGLLSLQIFKRNFWKEKEKLITLLCRFGCTHRVSSGKKLPCLVKALPLQILNVSRYFTCLTATSHYIIM